MVIAIILLIFGVSVFIYSVYTQKNKKHTEGEKQTSSSNVTFNMGIVDDDIVFPIHTKIKGVTFENRQEYLSESLEGDMLFIDHTPTDEYPNAISITNGRTLKQLGYVNSELANKLLDKFGAGLRLNGEIVEITGGTDGKNYGCNIIINSIK